MRFYWPIAKVDAEQRMVWGYASTEAVDEQGETVTRAALAAALDDYMRFANIREMHQPSAVGVATEATVDDRGLYIAARIVDPDAWAKVVTGVYKGFSIGGRVTARDPADRAVITSLALTEISVVDRPANPEAVFDCWKLSGRAANKDETADLPPSHSQGETPPGATDYADPGYLEDGRKRYPLDSERHIRAAWAYIHQDHNARRYTPGQLAHIKARIVAAWHARIDRAGPPAATVPTTARKGIGEVGRLAQVMLDLGWLYDRVAAGAAPAGDDPSQRLQALIAELCDVVGALVAEEAAAPAAADDGLPSAGLAAMAVAGALRKARQPNLAPLEARLAKLADDIVPRLDALQKRVEDIARTPLPPQTVARGLTAIAKRADGGSVAADADIVAALAQMTDEERTLTLIKAAHATPIMPFGRAAGSAAR